MPVVRSSEYELGYSEYPQGYLEYRQHLGHTWDSIQGTLSTHIEQLWVLLVLTGHYHTLQLPGVSTQGNVMGFSECSHGITKIGTLSTHMGYSSAQKVNLSAHTGAPSMPTPMRH